MHAEALIAPLAPKGTPDPREPRISLVGHWVEAGSVLRLAWAPLRASRDAKPGAPGQGLRALVAPPVASA